MLITATLSWVNMYSSVAFDPNQSSLNVEDMKMTMRTPIYPKDRHALYQQHGYSAAIQSGDLLFVSGQVGSLSDGSPEVNFEKQVELAFDNLAKTLAAAHCSFDDVIDVMTFHTDPENQFETIMKVKAKVFNQAPYPNWTAVGVNWLAGFDFEIKVTARIPATTSA